MADHQLDKPTTNDALAQLRFEHEERRNIRFAETRKRMQERERRKVKNQRETQDIRVRVSADVAERARRASKVIKDMTLEGYLRAEIHALADLVPRSMIERERTEKPQSAEDADCEEMIVGYVQDKPPGFEVTVSELLTMMDIPEAAWGREYLMRVGRIMKRLRWGRAYVPDPSGGPGRIWVYRKPHET